MTAVKDLFLIEELCLIYLTEELYLIPQFIKGLLLQSSSREKKAFRNNFKNATHKQKRYSVSNQNIIH